MTRLQTLPISLQQSVQNRSLLKVISGLNNFNSESVFQISKAAGLGGADLLDIACEPKLVELAVAASKIPVCVSAVEPELFPPAVRAGASIIEIGNFDSFYENGIKFSADQVLSLTKETKDLLPHIPLSVTVPHTLSLDKQVDLALQLIKEGVDIIQTEGGKSSKPYSSGIQGLFEKSVPTLAATFAIRQEFIKNAIDNPIMSASGLSQITCPLAITAGASAVGVGSVINKLDNMVGMIAGIRGLKESLDNSLKTQKIS